MIDLKELEQIIKQAVRSMEKVRENISELGDNIRFEKEKVARNLELLDRQSQEMVEQINQLQIKEKQAMLNLMEISKNYNSFNEESLREAYENAKELQIALGLIQEREVQLIERKKQLEDYFRSLDEAVDNAEQVFIRVGVAVDYIEGNFNGLGLKTEEAQQKQGIGLKIILAQEEERKRVAREIHDGPAQSMANLVLRTEICEKILDTKPQEVREELADLKIMVRNSLQEIRRIIFDLRPMAIDDLGLIATLKRYIEEYREKYPLNIELVTSGGPIIRQKDLEIAIFRIIQEALNNTVKHAHASDALIKIDVTDQLISVIVRDNGCGFKPEEKFPEGSFGLLGMRERVELIEGTLEINSAPGKGAEIMVRIPIKKSHEKGSGGGFR
ncbi:MAG: sensor histidine kinase [Dethiobacteria bacterium]